MYKFIKVRSQETEFSESQEAIININNIDMIIAETHQAVFNGGDRYIYLDDDSYNRLLEQIFK